MSGLLDNEEDVNAQIEAVLSEDQADEYERLVPDRAILKMLVTDNIAGAIIGKNGKAIAEIQDECGARIKVSQTADFYPGTSERTVLITGSGNSVLHAQDIIWQKIAQFYRPHGEGMESSNTISGKLLIPTESGGLIIGRGGVTIRAIQEESGARIQVTSKDNPESRISRERILTLTGSLGACIKGSQLVLLKMLEDPSSTYQNKSTSYGRLAPATASRTPANARSNGIGNDLALPLGAETLSATSTITLSVPESLIGQILGKKGSTIREIQQLSGSKVVVSARGESDESVPDVNGERTRTITITGSPSNAQMGQLLVTQKLQLAKNGIRR